MGALAAIVRLAGPAYVQDHVGRLVACQRRALDDITGCRTAAMGGTVLRCAECGAVEYRYHSCRNRHCPTCQEERAQDWLERTRVRLLPVEHHLVTFTLPSELRAVARCHQRVVYDALIREAAHAVQTLAADRRWVGGSVGILAVLHTWTRTLEYHPHVHLLVTAGGLSPDGNAWVKPAHERFLMPGYMLSALFRGRMRRALARVGLLSEVNPRVWRRRWTVNLQPAGTGEHATLYLSRYIYRVALTDGAIQSFSDGQVTVRYTHARTGETRRTTLPVARFLDRFLSHVLPRGLAKVRSYGLLSPGRKRDLERARSILAAHAAHRGAPELPPVPEASSSTNASAMTQLTVALIVLTLALRCPVCQRGQRSFHAVPRQTLYPSRSPP